MSFTPRMKLISILAVILVALPSGISFATVYSSQYVPAVISYEEPAIRLSNYSITSHNGQLVDISSYNVSATEQIEYGWSGPDNSGSFQEVNYSNTLLLQSITQTPFIANLSLISLSVQYKDLSNFSVYFQVGSTFYNEFSLATSNGNIVENSSSQNAIFNRSLPIRMGIIFQPAVNQVTEKVNNVINVDAAFYVNISHFTGKDTDIFSRYYTQVNLTLTTMAT